MAQRQLCETSQQGYLELMASLFRFGADFTLLAGLLFAGISGFACAQCGMMGGTGMRGMMRKGAMEPPMGGAESRPGATPSATPRRPSEIASGYEAFDQICGRCHVLPNPRVHTADQWPLVVERMRAHLAAAGGGLDQTTALEIDEILEREAER
jgi:hypothetical protein